VMIDLAPMRARRPKTLSPRRLRRERRSGADLLRIVDDDPERPRTRSECESGPRPCPYISCRFHLYLDVNEVTGSIKLNFPDMDPSELKESCVLDIAEQRGGLTLEEVGKLLNVTRERARQVEEAGLSKLLARV
jgi:hypothetical protein